VFLLAGSVPTDAWSGVGSAIKYERESVDGQKNLGGNEDCRGPRNL
jgi:hypothetical protein